MSGLTSHKAFKAATVVAGLLTSTALQANPLGIGVGITEDYSRGADALVRIQEGKTANSFNMQIINGRTQRLCNLDINVSDSQITASQADCSFYSASDYAQGLSEERGYKPSKVLNKAYKEFSTWRAENPVNESSYSAESITTPIEKAIVDSGADVSAYTGDSVAKDNRIRVEKTDEEGSNKDSTCLNLSGEAAVCFTNEYTQPYDFDTFSVDLHVLTSAGLVSSTITSDQLEWGAEVNDHNSGEEVQWKANQRILDSAGTPSTFGYR